MERLDRGWGTGLARGELDPPIHDRLLEREIAYARSQAGQPGQRFEFRSADSRGQDLRCLIEIPFLEDQYVDKTVRQLVAQIGPAVDQPTEASANRGSFLAVRRTS